jgi:hypothetical protein
MKIRKSQTKKCFITVASGLASTRIRQQFEKIKGTKHPSLFLPKIIDSKKAL